MSQNLCFCLKTLVNFFDFQKVFSLNCVSIQISTYYSIEKTHQMKQLILQKKIFGKFSEGFCEKKIK